MSLFGVYIVYRLFVLDPQRKNDLLNDYTIVQGEFLSFGRFEVGINTSTKFSYSFNGSKYEKRLMYKVPCKNFDINNREEVFDLKSKVFPVAVSSQDPNNAIALLRPEDFEVIKNPFPDSLDVFYKKYLECNFIQKHHY